MITYISDSHSKRPNNETKLNDTKTFNLGLYYYYYYYYYFYFKWDSLGLDWES